MTERKKPAPVTEAAEFESVPDEAPAEESIFDRARSILRGHRDAEPKEAKKKPPAPPRGHPNKDEIGELVALANLPIAMVSPRDAFTAAETERLTDALDTYAAKDERARRWMYGLAQRSALLALLNVVIAIALPRMIRHRLLPPTIAPYLTGLCDAAQLNDAVIDFPGAPASSPNGAPPDWTRPADIPTMPAA